MRALIMAIMLGLMLIAAPAVLSSTMDKDIIDTVFSDQAFSSLKESLEAADLIETLKGPGPFTLFAPTDDAFDAWPWGAWSYLLSPNNKQQLRSVMEYHVVQGKLMAADAAKLDNTATLKEGKIMTISVKDGILMVDKAKVIRRDIICSNGVIHVIDAALLPRR